jgi:hypothetical protein
MPAGYAIDVRHNPTIEVSRMTLPDRPTVAALPGGPDCRRLEHWLITRFHVRNSSRHKLAWLLIGAYTKLLKR